jgi:hypothetical protein
VSTSADTVPSFGTEQPITQIKAGASSKGRSNERPLDGSSVSENKKELGSHTNSFYMKFICFSTRSTHHTRIASTHSFPMDGE